MARARSAPFVGTSALFAAIFAITFLGEDIHPLVAAGTLSVVAGLIITGGEDMVRQHWRIDRRSLLGYLTGLGAAASYGGSNLVAKALTEEFGSPLVVAAFGMFFGTLILAPFTVRSAVEGLKNSTANLGFVALSGLASAVGVHRPLLRPGAGRRRGSGAHRLGQPPAHAAAGPPFPGAAGAGDGVGAAGHGGRGVGGCAGDFGERRVDPSSLMLGEA